MSIEVIHINKSYGNQKALQEVSFKINQGEIVGLLGPNGAGKSTLMKILTGYVSPTKGSAKICGLEVDENSIESKHKIGYLPEHNPLYEDMYVSEYLKFTADIQKVSQGSINEVIEKTGLKQEQLKLIGSLSKGYQQRVGLAQALIHNPEVLILDEPSTGLDPNQLVEIRNLIKEIGKEKTVILSTHIMQEVEAVCDRVIIINKGRIIADKSIEELHQVVGDQKIITVEFDQSIDIKNLNRLKNIIKVEELNNCQYRVISNSEFDVRPLLFKFAVDHNITVLQMNEEEQKIETIFHNLTKE